MDVHLQQLTQVLTLYVKVIRHVHGQLLKMQQERIVMVIMDVLMHNL